MGTLMNKPIKRITRPKQKNIEKLKVFLEKVKNKIK
jgi:hypothetical protein